MAKQRTIINDINKKANKMKIEATKKELEILGRALQALSTSCQNDLGTYDYSNPTRRQEVLQDRVNEATRLGIIITDLWKKMG
jgi:uncharacterized protein YoxC